MTEIAIDLDETSPYAVPPQEAHVTVGELLAPDIRIGCSAPFRQYHREVEGGVLFADLTRYAIYCQTNPRLLWIHYTGSWVAYRGSVSPETVHDKGLMPSNATPEEAVEWWNRVVEKLDGWEPFEVPE